MPLRIVELVFSLLRLPLLVTMECAFVPAAAHPVCGRHSRPSAVSNVRAGSHAWRTGGTAAAARLLPRQVAVEQRSAPHGVRMLSSNELRPGVTVEMDGSVWRVTEFLHVKPGKGAAFVRTKLKNMETGAALEKTFKVWFLLRLQLARAGLAGCAGGCGAHRELWVQGLESPSTGVVFASLTLGFWTCVLAFLCSGWWFIPAIPLVSLVPRPSQAGETVKQASLEKVTMQHTYVDGDDYVFMNMETYDEERLTAKVIGDRVKYMKEGLDVEVLKHNDRVLDVDLPTTITLRVTDTEPGVRGNTANNALKPATLETGATVMVPLFIEIDELVSVNTVEGKYLSRAKE